MSGGGSEPKEPKPTEEERALAETGARQWNRFVQDFVPTIHEGVDRARTSRSDLRDVDSMASSAAASEMPGLTQAAQSVAGGAGGGAFRQSVVAQGDDFAATTGAARGIARPGLEARQDEAMLSAAAQGRGLQGMGSRSAAEAGAQATDHAIQMQQLRDRNRRQFRRGLVSAAATGVGAYGQRQGWFDGSSGDPYEQRTGGIGGPHN